MTTFPRGTASPSTTSAELTLSGHKWPVVQVLLTHRLAVTADCSSTRVWAIPSGAPLATLDDLGGVTDLRWDTRWPLPSTFPRLGLLLASTAGGAVKAMVGGRKGMQEWKVEEWTKPSDPSVHTNCRAAPGLSTMLRVAHAQGKTTLILTDYLYSPIS